MLMAVEGPYALMVQPDDILISPREVDEHFGTMVCFHSRYALGDSHNYMDKDDFLREMYRSCPGVSPRRIASLVRSRRSKFHIICFRTRAKAHSFHCCSSSHKIFDFAGALNYREVVAALAGSISFGGGDSIFKVHRETVPSIGSQREGLFFNPPH